MVRSGDTGVNDWMFTQARECLADAGGAADAKPSTLDLKVEAIPELWPDWVSWDKIPVVTHDQVGRSAGRQVGNGRHSALKKSCARIERGSPGWRCLLRAATGYQHTPQTAERKFGSDSKGVVDFSSDLLDLCSNFCIITHLAIEPIVFIIFITISPTLS